MADRRSTNHCCKICCFCCNENGEKDELHNNLIESGHKEDIQPNNSVEPTFLCALPQPLLTGHLVNVNGTILPRCSRFSINFQCGEDSMSEKALHFNPRLEENYIVRNSYINGKWGDEETFSPYRLNLQRSGQFKISVFVADEQFLILLNDKHYCSYKFRIPLTKVTTLMVQGHVSVEGINTREESEYPPTELMNLPVLPIVKPTDNGPLPNPFTARLPEDLETKWQVEIIGKVKLLPQNFYFNLQDGTQIWPHPVVPLHLNPRFYSGQLIVVRNTYHGSWGAEERGLSQFIPGHRFHLVIRWENDEYSVWVNGKMTGIFKSKSRGSTLVNAFQAEGDFILYKVWVNTQLKNIFIGNMEKYSRDIMNGDI